MPPCAAAVPEGLGEQPPPPPPPCSSPTTKWRGVWRSGRAGSGAERDGQWGRLRRTPRAIWMAGHRGIAEQADLRAWAQCCGAYRPSAAPPPPRVTVRPVVVPLRGPGQSPALPFACCVGSLRSVGRCGRCSCWCRFRVRGAQWFGVPGLCGMWRDVPFASTHLRPQAVHNLQPPLHRHRALCSTRGRHPALRPVDPARGVASRSPPPAPRANLGPPRRRPRATGA